MRRAVLVWRGYLDAFIGRSWALGYLFIPTDHRVFICGSCIIHYISRWNLWRAEKEDVERTLIRRWGGSPEAVRRNLSKEDQIRARAYIEFESRKTLFLPLHLKEKPAGYDALEVDTV